jgi:flagellar protein FliT
MEEVSVIIKLYEEIAVLSSRMVKAAERKDWDALIQLDRSIRTLRTHLAQENGGEHLSDYERERKAVLIEYVLADNKKVRQCTELMMVQAHEFLDDAQELVVRKSD